MYAINLSNRITNVTIEDCTITNVNSEAAVQS
jgi:hypothetical protein